MKSLIKCGESNMMSPGCLTCSHVIEGTKQPIHGFCFDETDQSGNYICQICIENQSKDNLVAVCMHCTKNLLLETYDIEPQIDWLPNIFRGLP